MTVNRGPWGGGPPLLLPSRLASQERTEPAAGPSPLMDRTGERGEAGLGGGHTRQKFRPRPEERPRPPVVTLPSGRAPASSSPSAPPPPPPASAQAPGGWLPHTEHVALVLPARCGLSPLSLPPLCERLIPAVGPRVCMSCSPPPQSAISPALSSHMYPAYGRLSGRGIERLLTLPQTKRSQAAAATAAGGAW